jgi:hypothetical protein
LLKLDFFLQVLAFATFAREWPLLSFFPKTLFDR